MAVFLILSVPLANANDTNFWVNLGNDRVDLIRDALATGADPNQINDKGQPALMQAVRDQAWKTFDLLLAHRQIDVNAANQTDETSLMYIALVGDIPRATALIQKGAQVNRLGWTPLHYAASMGQTEMLRFLIQHDAIVNAPAPDGSNPLMMAAYYGSEAAVRQLLAAGADAAAVNGRGEDAALWARRRHHEELASKLDALKQKVQADRQAAAHTGASSAPAAQRANNSSRSIAELNGSQPRAANALPETNATDEQPSSSSYFDLDRFERDDNPEF